MSKQIDIIMRISDKGYVDDFNDIEEILEHFLSYTVETLTCVLPPGYKIPEFADNIVRNLGNIELEGNSIDYIMTLRLSDLLCLMRYFEVFFIEPDVSTYQCLNTKSNVNSRFVRKSNDINYFAR